MPRWSSLRKLARISWPGLAAMTSMRAAAENEQALIFAGLGDKDRTFEALESMGSRGPSA